MCGPYSGGQSHQRQPHLSTCTIPLITRRSSARSTPRTSVGKCGSIRAHCSSLSQNKFLLINPSPTTNQYRIVEAEGLMSSDPSREDDAAIRNHIWRQDIRFLASMIATRVQMVLTDKTLPA